MYCYDMATNTISILAGVHSMKPHDKIDSSVVCRGIHASGGGNGINLVELNRNT